MHGYNYIGHNSVNVFFRHFRIYGISPADGNQQHVYGQNGIDKLGRTRFAQIAEMADVYSVHAEFENNVLATLFSAALVVKRLYRVDFNAGQIVAALFVYHYGFALNLS